MDKGFSSSRDPRTRRPPPPPQQPPKTIGKGPPRPDDLEFNDSSRDPRLNHDKYQKIMNKNRISPDTTAKMMKSEPQEISQQEKCTYCPMSLNQRKIQDHVLNKHKNLLFACGLCSGSAGSIFESIQETRSHVQNIHEIAEEIVDKLIKLPTGNFLKSYKCIMCPGNTGNLIGVSEETLKMHFKEKHKTNAIKPFMLKRTCRICNYDKAPSDVELKKHFETVHPKSDYWQDDEEEPDEELETEVKTEAPEETYSQSSSKYETSEYGQQRTVVETYKTEKNAYEDGLDYEPQDDERSQSPQNPIDSMPEEGEVSDEPSTSKKSKKRKKESISRSSSRSSRSSASEKPKQYKDSDSDNSSSEDEVKIKPKKKKKSKKSHKEKESKRKVYVKEDDDHDHDRDRDRERAGDHGAAKPKSRDDSFFGVTYIPPAGFCEECDVRYENGEKAQYHFKSRNHMYNVKDKYRCYFCNSYVQDTKGHLESQHRDMTFKCLLRGCAQPRFTQANKVIDHVRCNHPQDYKKTRSDDDLFRMRMVSMPRSLSSYGCRECNVVFHGDIKIAIVHLVLEHGRNIPERHHLRFSCRVCSNKESFSDPKDLERHCQIHYEAAKGSYVDPRSRSQSTGRDSRSSSRSRSRSPRERDRSRTPERRWRSPPDRRSPPGRARSPPGRRSPPPGRRSPPPGRRSPPPSSRRSYSDGGLRTEVERDRENERSDKGGRSVFTCHYCKDQFRTLSVRKNHMLREHERFLFNCGFCTFVNMYRRDLLWHLREHHRKTGYSDEMMLREMVKWPKDLRKVVCIKCTESEANENSTWLCCDPNEITKELKAHAGERHNVFDDEVESCYNLQCSGCTDKWELAGEIKDWDQHMEEVPCKNRRRSRTRSRSKSRSRSRSGSGSRRPRSPPPPRRTGRSSPVEVNVEHQCSYCPKEIDDKYKMDEHIRQRHLDVAFVCRLCDTGDHHYEPDLVSMKKHLKESHDKEDIDNEDPMDFVRYPKNLICIKCNMCGLLCHAQKISEVELHFNIAHEELDFNESHLQFLCRICTKEFESLDDVKDHLEEVHPEELK